MAPAGIRSTALCTKTSHLHGFHHENELICQILYDAYKKSFFFFNSVVYDFICLYIIFFAKYCIVTNCVICCVKFDFYF